MKNTNTLIANVLHTVAQGVVWAVPMLLLQFPELGKLTIAGALSLLVSYLNNFYHAQA